MKTYSHTGRFWRREFFALAGFMLGCKLRACDGEPDRCGVLLGEMDCGAEMHLVLKYAGMLPRQRLARCAALLMALSRKARSSRSSV
jgi:hypothetical protein